MSKQLDFGNLSEEDKEWLRARSQAHLIPSEGEGTGPQGVVIAPNASGEEQLALRPNTGVAMLYPEDFDGFNGAETYTEEDYESWKVSELDDEIKDRNSKIDEYNEAHGNDEGFQPLEHLSTEGKKADKIATLLGDDQKRADEQDEQEQGE